jgi:stage IV sporulation protein FB
MARLRGLRVGGIFLHVVPFAYVERGKPADELRTALAGPATNVLIAAALFALPQVRGGFPWLAIERWIQDPLWAAFGINLLMGVLNLLPALPADGGRALRAALMLRMPPADAYAITARTGTFTGAACFFVAVLLWPATDAWAAVVAGVFFVMVAWREARQGQLERRQARARTKAP